MKRAFAVLLAVLLISAVPAAPALAAEGGGSESVEAIGKDGENHPEFAYITLQSVTVPIITERGLTQQLSIGMTMEVPWEEKKKFEAYQPRLIDAYIQDLYGAVGSGFGLMKGGVVDIVTIKARLVKVTERVLGPDLKAHDLLLQVVQQQAK